MCYSFRFPPRYHSNIYLYLGISSFRVQISSNVNHTFAGVRYVMKRRGSGYFKLLTAELIAFAAGAHHGLFDGVSPVGDNGFLYRAKKEGIGYDEAETQFLSRCASQQELDELFEKAAKELESIFYELDALATNHLEITFYMSLFSRLALSYVIDADRANTRGFMLGQPDEPPRDMKADMKPLWKRLLEQIETYNKSLAGGDSPINSVRREISERCREFALDSSDRGVFRLSVPTGGGKTLTSLRYAITAAHKHEKRRIFFVIPLLSVLEQNAAAIRKAVDDDSVILEHHSNVVREKAEAGGHYQQDAQALLMESWDSPIIITTLVQLLDSLFAGKTSRIRRMSALADSVIVIDEVQSVPRKMLSLFNMAVNFLAYFCNCQIILCSATQPCLEAADHAVKYSENADMVKISPEMQAVFKRTVIVDKRSKYGFSSDELADFAAICLQNHGATLLICNKKSQAREYFALLKSRGVKAFHLSTAMCMQHRRDTLAEIQSLLDSGDSIAVLRPGFYSEEQGVIFEGHANSLLEV